MVSDVDLGFSELFAYKVLLICQIIKHLLADFPRYAPVKVVHDILK